MKNLIALCSFFLCLSAQTYIVNGLELIPGGENIAFTIYPDGIIVTGSYLVGNYNPSRDSDIIKGDRIIKIGDNKVTDLHSFLKELPSYYEELNCPIKIIRNNVEYNRNLELVYKEDTYKTGLYVKERIIGLGTVSYYDPVSKSYGALGHEVYDEDSSTILQIRKGEIYLEDVESINKSKNGDVGSKNSDITFEEKIGEVKKNTRFGLYGIIDEIPSNYTPIKVAEIDEIKLGKAKVLTCIKEDKVEEFDIEITNINKQNLNDIKSMQIKIVDEKLITYAGGIYKGMSGSPIVQNNMLIGCVTHVSSDNVRQGYALFMKTMYEMSF